MYKFPVVITKCKTLDQITSSKGVVKENTDGTVMVYYNNVPDYNTFNNKSCCEKLGYKFDTETQKCYSKTPPASTGTCTTKIVYNPKDNDGVLFNVNDGETCELKLTLDYLLNFDCDLFTKTCSNNPNTALAKKYNIDIAKKEKEIKDTRLIIATLEAKLASANDLFDGLCYVIKGTKTSSVVINNLESNSISTIGQWSSPWLAPSNFPAPNTNVQPIAPAVSNGPTAPDIPSIASPDATLTNFDTIPTFYITEDTNLTSLVPNNNIVFRGTNPSITDNILPLGPLNSPIKFKNLNNIGIINTNDTIPNNTPPPPPFAWQWKLTPYFNEAQTPTNRVTRGGVSYCLTERGLNVWKSILGDSSYNIYIGEFGCNTIIYTQADFDNFLKSVNSELLKNSALSTPDFYIETKQGTCDKKNANNSKAEITLQLTKPNADIIRLNDELKILKDDLAILNVSIGSIEAITNLENLKVFLNLEYYNTTSKKYEIALEDSIFDIGTGNLLSFILNDSPNTGILISGVTAGGILAPSSDSGNTQTFCDVGRGEFIKQLYLQQYKGVYDDPVTPAEQLDFNKKMNNWYNSSWLYYDKIIESDIAEIIKNKKIRISLRVENCCLDLCVLTDNIGLTKICESLDNQEIIISKSPQFEIEKVLDNKKSWVSYTENTSREHDLQFRETQYNIDDYRLSINTKEIDLKIDGSNAIEEDVLYNISYLMSDYNQLITQTSFANLFTFTADTNNNITSLASNDTLLQSFYDLGLLNDKLIGIPSLASGSTLNFGDTVFNETERPYVGLNINDWMLTNIGTVTTTTIVPTSFLSNESNIIIPSKGSATPFPVTFTVTGITSNIQNISLKLSGFTHGYLKDVSMLLLSPFESGTAKLTPIIFDNSNGINNINVTFSNDTIGLWGGSTNNGTFLNNSTPIYDINFSNFYFVSGTTYQDMTTFVGLSPIKTNGTWVLYIKDFVSGDGGSIINATLNIDSLNYQTVVIGITGQTSGTTIHYTPTSPIIDLDVFLTTELATINNVDEFRKAITSELIDVKSRQTLSSYPTLRLLYERYLGYCTDCNKNGNKFTYASMDTFIDLIGKHWVDLAEQFVPATTIWGATDVYRNTVFHQQKHTYRRSNLEFKRQVTDVNTIIGFEPLRTIENTYQSIIYDVSIEQMPEILEASASTINFQAAAQIDETPRSNPSSPITLNFQVGTTTQTFGNLNQAQLDLIQSQINSSNSASGGNNIFQKRKSVNTGLSSGPGHSSPIFYGKITVNNTI
jgi:hypothetical protein